MDLIFIIVSASSIAIVIAIYFLSKRDRMEAHQKMLAEGKPWTQVPMTNLSVGAALVVLGIVIDVGSRTVNYILIAAGLAITIIEGFKLFRDKGKS